MIDQWGTICLIAYHSGSEWFLVRTRLRINTKILSFQWLFIARVRFNLKSKYAVVLKLPTSQFIRLFRAGCKIGDASHWISQYVAGRTPFYPAGRGFVSKMQRSSYVARRAWICWKPARDFQLVYFPFLIYFLFFFSSLVYSRKGLFCWTE